jgi:hypothetical protein
MNCTVVATRRKGVNVSMVRGLVGFLPRLGLVVQELTDYSRYDLIESRGEMITYDHHLEAAWVEINTLLKSVHSAQVQSLVKLF